MDRFVVISGCSSAGKSTLLAEFQRRGFAVVEEPGRRIVQEETNSGGRALPWVDPEAFLRRALAMATADHEAAARTEGWVFFDRSAVDAASGLQSLTGEPTLAEVNRTLRYHRRVFLAEPWPELFENDGERRHSLEEARAEYDRLLLDYPSLGYEIVFLPKVSVGERADFMLEVLGPAPE